MRIAYGVHGYGRGHASRAMALVPELARKHEVLLMAGGDAFDLLSPERDVCRIPTLRYHYGENGRLSALATAMRTLPSLVDLFMAGPALETLCETLSDFNPHVVISDAEAWTHRAARRLGIPRIGLDHFGIMVYCKPEVDWHDSLALRSQAWTYRRLMGQPDRVIVSSFYDVPPRRDGMSIVAPMLRDEVLHTEPRRGEHLLVYLNKGEAQFDKHLRDVLRAVDAPVFIYGLPPRRADGNLQFRPLSNLPFVEDLASCRALISTAGNQLIGEAMHFGKPALVMPEDVVEQRLNAAAIQRLGIGKRTTFKRISPEVIGDFLALHDTYRANMSRIVNEEWVQAGDMLERYIQELAPIGEPAAGRRRIGERKHETA